MAARSCLKCKEQRLIGFEGYNCGSTAVVKCRWAALLHRLPQSKNHVVAERILPFTNLLYLTLKLSKSRLWEAPSSCLFLRLGPTWRGKPWTWSRNFDFIYKYAWKFSCWHRSTHTFFFFLALVKMPLPIPTHLLGILPSLKLRPLLPDILIWCWLHFTSFTQLISLKSLLSNIFVCLIILIVLKYKKPMIFAIIPF